MAMQASTSRPWRCASIRVLTAKRWRKSCKRGAPHPGWGARWHCLVSDRKMWRAIVRFRRCPVSPTSSGPAGVAPGNSAVVIMASKITGDRFSEGMAPFGGTVLKTSLSEQDEKELAAELAEGS